MAGERILWKKKTKLSAEYWGIQPRMVLVV